GKSFLYLLIISLIWGLIPVSPSLAAGAGQPGSATLTSNLEAHTNYEWDTVPMGGGGYVTGMVIHPTEPDLIYIRTDVGGMYRWNAADSSWIPLINHITMAEKNLYGIDSIAIDPSDPDVVYAAAGKYDYWTPSDILKSTDRGETWVRTNLKNGTSDVRMKSNGEERDAGERIAVDPNNSNTVYFASRYDGLWKSTTGASSGSWTRVTSFPVTGTAPSGLTFAMFAPASGAGGTAPTPIYVGAWGSGMYKSLDGGATWTSMSGSPASPVRAVSAPGDILYVGHKTGLAKFQLATGAWTDITPPAAAGIRHSGITVDAANPNVIMTASNNGGHNNPIFRSTDGGTTWNEVKYYKDQTVPWAPGWHWSSATSSIMIDPFNSNRVWYTDWYNVWRTDDINASPSTWISYPKGHEEIVTVSNLTSPPSGEVKLFSGVADVGGFEHTSLVAPPEKTYYTSGGLQYLLTTSVDFQETNPSFVVRVGTNGWQGNGDGGYSTDQGKTYTKFSKPWSTATGGRVALSANSERIVWYPRGYDAIPWVSTDRGATWTASVGAPLGAVGGGSSIFKYNQPLASDRVNGQKFYLYNGGKLYRSIDGALNWSLANGSLPNNGENHNLYAAPGIEGEVWVSLDDSGLYRSSNSGTTFSKLAQVDRAFLFAFGKSAPGLTNPAVYVYGTVNGVDGIFRSDDMGTTWVKISIADTIPGNDPNIMGADRQVYGRVYVGTNGSGILYGQPTGTLDGTDKVAPTKPTHVTVTYTDDMELDLSWVASTDNVGIQSYKIYKNNSELVATVSNTTSSYKVTGLVADTSYSFTIKARDAEGNFSASSDRLVVKTNKYPNQLIKNSGFEADLTSWSVAATSGSVVTTPTHEGVKALRVEAAKGGQQTITGFQANKAYTLSAWGKASASGQTASIQAWGSSVNSSISFTSTDWTYKEIKFITPPDMSWLQVKINNGSSAGEFYIDDVSLKLSATESELPTAPLHLVATKITGNTIGLSWDASTDNIGVEGYEIYRDGVKLASTANTFYSAYDLIGNTPYIFTVKAKDTSWNLSNASAPLQAVTNPNGPNLVLNSGFETGLTSWSLSNATTVTDSVYSGQAALRLGAAGNGQQGLTTLKPNTTYMLSSWGKVATAGSSAAVYLQATGVSGTLTFSGTEYEYKSLTFTTPAAISWLGVKLSNTSTANAFFDDLQLTIVDTAAPTTPDNLVVQATDSTTAALSWSPSMDVNSVARYVIYSGGVEIGTTRTTSFNLSGLVPGTTYSFTVRAEDSAGNASPLSTAVTLAILE
ncbi:MAG: fibronectin type III domain-containing protein, partial [Gorillibacterium sp.]|nr:fibronectin type III domain-containing protein [Gorillibacterium sp.]